MTSMTLETVIQSLAELAEQGGLYTWDIDFVTDRAVYETIGAVYLNSDNSVGWDKPEPNHADGFLYVDLGSAPAGTYDRLVATNTAARNG